MTGRVPETPTDGREIDRLAVRYACPPERLAAVLHDLRTVDTEGSVRHGRVKAAVRKRKLTALLLDLTEHHAPVPGERGLHCGGCDTTNADPPPWPCSTYAKIAEAVGE